MLISREDEVVKYLTLPCGALESVGELLLLKPESTSASASNESRRLDDASDAAVVVTVDVARCTSSSLAIRWTSWSGIVSGAARAAFQSMTSRRFCANDVNFIIFLEGGGWFEFQKKKKRNRVPVDNAVIEQKESTQEAE